MKRVFLLMCACLLFPALAMGQNLVYELTLQGKSCVVRDNQQIDCSFKVGDLAFDIVGVGMPDTAITFMQCSFDGEFYASYGVAHGCVIVKPGKIVLDAYMKNGLLPQFAFVSPKNAKVYQTWQECQAGH